jgi:carboxypeptidase C (cathepsin A)
MILPLWLVLAAGPQVTASPSPGTSTESGADKPADKSDKSAEKDKDKDKDKDEPPVVTRHEASVGGKVVRYSVTTGMMPLKNDAGETEADVFFMAYVADRPGPASARPLTFSFNGGPGSSSVWLHLGALGP